MIKNNDNITYSGIVTIGIKFKNKIVQKWTYKNKGCLPMFYGIASALAGNYSQALSYAPKYLKLYYSDSPNTYYNSEDILITPAPFFYTDTPRIREYANSYDGSNPEAAVTFKFNVPFSALDLGATNEINKCCLCSDYNKSMIPTSTISGDNYKDLFNAFFEIPTPIDLTGISDKSNYSVYIEWTLKIKNN